MTCTKILGRIWRVILASCFHLFKVQICVRYNPTTKLLKIILKILNKWQKSSLKSLELLVRGPLEAPKAAVMLQFL